MERKTRRMKRKLEGSTEPRKKGQIEGRKDGMSERRNKERKELGKNTFDELNEIFKKKKKNNIDLLVGELT